MCSKSNLQLFYSACCCLTLFVTGSHSRYRSGETDWLPLQSRRVCVEGGGASGAMGQFVQNCKRETFGISLCSSRSEVLANIGSECFSRSKAFYLKRLCYKKDHRRSFLLSGKASQLIHWAPLIFATSDLPTCNVNHNETFQTRVLQMKQDNWVGNMPPCH